MDWSEILEKARAAEDKSWLAEHMPTLCSPETLEEGTRLRVLGNAVANNQANRQFLLDSGFAKELLSPSTLNFSVLLNFCVDFEPAARQLYEENGQQLRQALLDSKQEARAAAKRLMGVIAQELDLSTQPLEAQREAVLAGFIELVLVNPALEQDPTLLAEFTQIYNHALDLDNYLDAMQVIGNITSHQNFTLEHASGVEPAISPIFFIILTNLTGKLADVPAVMAKFPDGLQLVLDFVDSDDFEHDEYNSCAHFLRNVGRTEENARRIAASQGLLDMVEDLLESPFAEVGIQLLGVIGQHLPRYEWFEVLAQANPDPSINAALLVAYSQLCIPLGAGTPEAVPQDAAVLEPAAAKIIELLEATPSIEQTASLWLKGSKALALLSRHIPIPSVQHLKESAPAAQGIQQNFEQIA